MSVLSRTETKVWATTAGGTSGGTVAAAIIWALGVYHWHASDKASDAAAAIASVPLPLSALIGLVSAVAGAWLFGYNAPPSNHAGNNATGELMDDAAAGHEPLLQDLVNEVDHAASADSHVAGH